MEIIATIAPFFIIADTRPLTAEKKIIYDAIANDEIPASLTDAVKSKFCLEISAELMLFSFLSDKIKPVINEDTRTDR